MANKKPNPLTVQAKDCYNPEDYIMVHKTYVEKMEAYREDWIKAVDEANRIIQARDAALDRITHLDVTFREYVMTVEALMKFDPSEDRGSDATKKVVLTPFLYDHLKLEGYDMSIYHRDALIPTFPSTSACESPK